jgi:hypothetical protein
MRNDEGYGVDDGLDPQARRWLDAAYSVKVDVATAAGHLWRIHREADTEPVVLPDVPDVLVERAEQIAGATVAARPDQSAAVQPAPGPRRPRRSLVAVLSAVFMFATSGIAVAASGGALPGQVLYPVKLGAERAQLLDRVKCGLERAQLILTIGSERDAQLHLRIAKTRLDEASAVAADRPETVPRLLVAAADAADRAERLAGPSVSDGVAEVRQATGTALTDIAARVDSTSASELGVLAGRLGLDELVVGSSVAQEGTDTTARVPARTDDSAPSSARAPEEPPVRLVDDPPAFPPLREPAADEQLAAEEEPAVDEEAAAAPPPAAERPDPPRASPGTAEPPTGPEGSSGGSPVGGGAEDESASEETAADEEAASESEEPAEDEAASESEAPPEDEAASDDAPPSEDEGGAKRRPDMDELAERFEES